MKFNKTNFILCLGIISLLLIPATPVTALEFENPLTYSAGTPANVIIGSVILNVIGLLINISASLALLSIVISGTYYLLGAAGGEQQVAKAKQILIWSIIGLVIIGTATLILWAVQATLGI